MTTSSQEHTASTSLPQTDQLQRFLFDELGVRGTHAYLKDTWREITHRRDYPAAIRKHLGDAVVGAALLQTNLKSPTKLTFQIQPNGQSVDQSTAVMPLLVVQINEQGHIRAMAKWDQTKLDTMLANNTGSDDKSADELPLQALCEGSICAISLEPTQGSAYQGIVALNTDTIAEALEGYFHHSEQLPTRIQIAQSEDALFALLYQRIPAIQLKTNLSRETLENNWAHVKVLADTLSEEEFVALPLAQIMKRLFVEDNLRLFEPEPIQFACRCSEQQMLSVLSNFDESSVHDMVEPDSGKVEVTCEFCGHQQAYDLIDIAAARNQSPAFDDIATQNKGSLH